MENLYLIAGLGNPGTEYSRTRHNAGFLLTDLLAERWGGVWQQKKRFGARLAKARFGLQEVLICQPQTYMNLSGEALRAVVDFYQAPIDRLLVAVDDADLPLGTIRLRPEGSSGGHHGLESIEQQLGTRRYARLRLGIGRSAAQQRQLTGHVLGKFAPEEWELFEKALERAAQQIECWINEGMAKAMSKFNGPAAGPMEEKDKE